VGKELAEIGLVAVAGILIGGVYSMYKAAKLAAAIVLGVLALIAVGGAVAWFLS
jgi:hypothetical protein